MIPVVRSSATLVLAGMALAICWVRPAQAGAPELTIQSRIDSGSWVGEAAIHPVAGQAISLRVDAPEGARIRWYQIAANLAPIYHNANLPWETDAYAWVGFDTLEYTRIELESFRDQAQIQPFAEPMVLGSHAASGGDQHFDRGSFWFQVEVETPEGVQRSAGLEDSDHRGLSTRVMRVSIREGEGLLGHLTSFFNVPGVFGSVVHQSQNHLGVDCADVIDAAWHHWKGRSIGRNVNVAMLMTRWPTAHTLNLSAGIPDQTLTWSRDVFPGDVIAVRYVGAKGFQHIGVLERDANENGVLDAGDLVIHAGPHPLRSEPLARGGFDGELRVFHPD